MKEIVIHIAEIFLPFHRQNLAFPFGLHQKLAYLSKKLLPVAPLSSASFLLKSTKFLDSNASTKYLYTEAR